MNIFSSINHYWSFAGLFEYRPTLLWPLQWWYVGLMGLLLVVLVSSLLLRKQMIPALRGLLISVSLTNLLWGAVLYFFRVQHIPLLGMDLWRFVQELGLVIYLSISIPRIIKNHRLTQQVVAHETAKSKYLPKPKKS
jgi:hypothetical protein